MHGITLRDAPGRLALCGTGKSLVLYVCRDPLLSPTMTTSSTHVATADSSMEMEPFTAGNKRLRISNNPWKATNH